MNNKHFTNQVLEQYVLRELPPEKIDEIEREMLENKFLKERIEYIEKSNNEIHGQYPAEIFVKRIENNYNNLGSLQPEKDRFDFYKIRKILYAALAVTSAVLLIFLYNINEETIREIEDPIEITRAKGLKTQLYIFKKNNSSVEILKDGSRARESDLLQLAYVSTEDNHGVIFSIDGRGAVTLQYPPDPKNSTRIDPGRRNLLKRSYELDDAPEFERFYFLTSKSEIDVNEVLEKAKKIAKDPSIAKKDKIVLDEKLNQYSTLILKKENKDEE